MTGRDSAAVDFGKLFASIDAMDTEGFLGFLTEDAEFRFASAPAVRGHAAIAAAVGGFFQSIAGLRHRLDRFVSEGSVTFCEGEVTYTRHDGSEVVLPFSDVFETADGLITVYRIYIDIGPLFAS